MENLLFSSFLIKVYFIKLKLFYWIFREKVIVIYINLYKLLVKKYIYFF